MRAKIIDWLQQNMPPRMTFLSVRILRAAAHLLSAFQPVKRIVIDMDGPLFNFEQGFIPRWNALWPALSISVEERHNWKIEQDVIAKYSSEGIAKVFGEALLVAEIDPLKEDNGREKLVQRAARRQVLDIINTPGFFTSLEPNWENIEQVKRIIDLGKYEVGIMSAVPDENTAGIAEKTKALKVAFGDYFSRLHNRIYVTGQRTEKGDTYWDVIFEDNTSLGGNLKFVSGLHMIVETEHNKTVRPTLFQKFVPKGADWIEAAGL